ncbi:hypothetical protein [Pseudomonas nitroreducens]|uniref:hypothetical protein n=1 Tax=Pseudomonas nitroreducens TaxID=46680 RepID=UPI00351D6E41
MPLSATRPPSPQIADSLDLATPQLTRQRRWIDDSRFRMRRIVVLRNQQKEIVGYRPMIQQGTKESRRDYYQTFKPTSEMSMEQALQAAMEWRDNIEKMLGIVPGNHSAAGTSKPVACISLIVSQTPPYRAHWATNQTSDGIAKIRVSIGARNYQDAYAETVTRLAQREGIAAPDVMPLAPPPKRDQYRRMVKAGLLDIPQPETAKSRRKPKA